jgi:hypothetical protein
MPGRPVGHFLRLFFAVGGQTEWMKRVGPGSLVAKKANRFVCDWNVDVRITRAYRVGLL